MQKLKNNEARPKFTGSYKKKKRVLDVTSHCKVNLILGLTIRHKFAVFAVINLKASKTAATKITTITQ